MRQFKRAISILEILSITFFIALGYCSKNIKAEVAPPSTQTPIKIDVFLYGFNDKYISLVKQNFENIQRNNQGKVEFTFYDGINDQLIQNKDINSLLQKRNTNLILLNIVDVDNSKVVINRIKEKGIPVILFNREPLNIEDVKSYNKAFFVGTNASQAGILQGQILINEWNSNKNMDTNKDNVMQYIMLMGERDNIEAMERTRYSVLTINNSGIRTQEIALRVAGWDRNTARDMIGALYLQDAQAMAEVTYKMGMNLIEGRNPLDGIAYEFDSTGVAVRIPYREIIS